ncbi:sigma factor G inhibitor Gin [Mechercharimyces sp. CAU 1602]|uniref:sigma factor G inhibitor Gin n=1 Tax=Mechercharimyces sp. CAU 1602 TaxID=2973933 RepID=UPI0021618B86|nr:sigma factor G inhibitor Gin [Mechercharimyces sp. CAU 1602]MCS1352353.1 sigma factor G inhibitor Gin [Mechercharimyces sp. CAU 1602]
MSHLGETSYCIICDQRRDDGLLVLDEFICEACERELVQTAVTDQKYSYYVQQLKKIWLKDA